MNRCAGRKLNQLRQFSLVRGFPSNAPGSVLVKAGETCVLCTASISNRDVPDFVQNGHGWIDAQYSMLPGSTLPRSEREVILGKQRGRTQEIQRFIARNLRAVVDMKLLSGFLISIDCDVLKADGGTRCASITGAWVALVDVITTLIKSGDIQSNPIKDIVAAVSVGIINGEILLDMDYYEDKNCDVDANLVMTGSGYFIELQSAAERSLFSKKDLDIMLDIGQSGIQELFIKQKKCVFST